MTEVLDQYTAGTEPDDFAEADLPDDIAGQDDEEVVPPHLRWGETVDPKTGELRVGVNPAVRQAVAAQETLCGISALRAFPLALSAQLTRPFSLAALSLAAAPARCPSFRRLELKPRDRYAGSWEFSGNNSPLSRITERTVGHVV